MSKTSSAPVTGAKIRKTITNCIVHVILAILSFIWVLPIFWVVLTSFRAEKGSYVTTFFPQSYTLNNYKKLFTDTTILNFPLMFKNTFVIAIFTCIISTIFVLSVYYCMSRMRFKRRKPVGIAKAQNLSLLFFPVLLGMVDQIVEIGPGQARVDG